MARLAPGVKRHACRAVWIGGKPTDAIYGVGLRPTAVATAILEARRYRVARVIHGDTGHLPAAQHAVGELIRIAQPLPAPAHRELVDVIDQEFVAVVKFLVSVFRSHIPGVL